MPSITPLIIGPSPSVAGSSIPSVSSLPAPAARNNHPMQTHGKSGIFKPKIFFTATFSSSYMSAKPSSFTAASKLPVWQQAVAEEYEALTRQHTWDITPLPPRKSAIGCKWVYRIKRHPDGFIACHKARLVAKGYHQQEGIDFEKTFSPVVKKAHCSDHPFSSSPFRLEFEAT